eukprot:1160628-Pelagomonas_calceolata.AAC.23
MCPPTSNKQTSVLEKLPEDAKVENYQLGRTCAGSMQKTGNLGPQLAPSAEILHLINHWVFPLHFFCNAVLLLQGLKITKMTQFGAFLVQNGDLVVKKFGFTPQLIWHVIPNWYLSRPSATEKNACQFGDAYAWSTVVPVISKNKGPKNTCFQASDEPLCGRGVLRPEQITAAEAQKSQDAQLKGAT